MGTILTTLFLIAVYFGTIIALDLLKNKVTYEQVLAFVDRLRSYRDAGEATYKGKREQCFIGWCRYGGYFLVLLIVVLVLTPVAMDVMSVWYWITVATIATITPFVMKVRYGWQLERAAKSESES